MFGARLRLLIGALVLMLASAACATTSAATPAQRSSALLAGITVVDPGTTVDADSSLADQRVDAIFSGAADDGDFNTLAVSALGTLAEQGVHSRYLSAVSVTDAETVLRAMAEDGATIIWTHGSQFYPSAVRVALDHPDVAFIGEVYGRPDNPPKNMWILDPQFYPGFYALGAFAADLTESGIIGYIGGVRLPFSFSEVHAIRQAIADAGSNAEVRAVWTGDFNDVDKAETLTGSLIEGGADVILGSLNGGAVGTFRAAATAKEAGQQVWVTAKYSDKSALDSSGIYAGTLRTNFGWPLLDVIGEIQRGVRTGYHPFGFNGGVHLAASPAVPRSAHEAMRRAIQDISADRVDVIFDTSSVDE